jgi:hypothetical protein
MTAALRAAIDTRIALAGLQATTPHERFAENNGVTSPQLTYGEEVRVLTREPKKFSKLSG